MNFFSNNGGNTRPVAINDAGDISGYYIKSGSGSTSAWRGAIWKVDARDPRKSTKVDLPLLPSADPLSASAIPFAFNKSNEAAGWAADSAIGQHAAFWKGDAAHTIVDLGVFGSDWSSVANSLNDLGQVVGSSHPPFGSRPVLWHNDPAHTAYELPLLPGHNYGSADLINGQGIMVGSSAASEPRYLERRSKPNRHLERRRGQRRAVPSRSIRRRLDDPVHLERQQSRSARRLRFPQWVNRAIILMPLPDQTPGGQVLRRSGQNRGR